MGRPHPALIAVAAGRPVQSVDDPWTLVQSAFEHAMHGLVWRSIGTGGIEVPPDARRALANETLHTEMRHLGMWDGLREVTQRLGSAGIEAAAFKGVVAERRWYSEMGDRPCWDVDLLLSPHQLDRAREAVEIINPGHRMAPVIDELIKRGETQDITLPFGTTSIDLHFDLFKFGYPVRQPGVIWERTEMLSLDDGSEIRVLDTEVSLVHFLYHLNRDKFKRLLGYVDIVRLLGNPSIDHDFIRGFVAAEGLSTQYALSLKAVTEDLGLPGSGIPVPSGWRSPIWRIAWRPSTRLLGMSAEVRFLRRGALLLPGLVHGRVLELVRYWLRRLFPSRDAIDLKHPHTRGPYLWRLISGRFGHRRQKWKLRRSIGQTSARRR